MRAARRVEKITETRGIHVHFHRRNPRALSSARGRTNRSNRSRSHRWIREKSAVIGEFSVGPTRRIGRTRSHSCRFSIHQAAHVGIVLAIFQRFPDSLSRLATAACSPAAIAPPFWSWPQRIPAIVFLGVRPCRYRITSVGCPGVAVFRTESSPPGTKPFVGSNCNCRNTKPWCSVPDESDGAEASGVPPDPARSRSCPRQGGGDAKRRGARRDWVGGTFSCVSEKLRR